MTTQSEKNEISVKLKGLKNKISSVTTYLTGIKVINKKLEKYNELLDEARKTKPRFMILCATRIMKY